MNGTMGVSRGAILAEAATTLAEAGHQEPRRCARRLIASALGISAADLLMHPEQSLDCVQTEHVRRIVERVAAGEPPSRVFRRREFWGLDFALSDETLDPRPETETIVEAVVARVTDQSRALKLLDLGTGTGCLLLALLSELPTATGVGVDRSEDAAATARRNARLLGLADRAGFFVGDWGSALGRKFDVIVANPPYIATAALSGLPREVREYDPLRALDGGDDGLAAYRAIAGHIPALLAPAGILAVEIGAGQTAAVVTILTEYGVVVDAVERDLAGIARCVVARHTASALPEAADAVKGVGKKALECRAVPSRVARWGVRSDAGER
jgi:release factor glutamine methyltransferase